MLAALAATKPAGRLAESGTGYGAGAAWLSGGMAAHAVLVTVERDSRRAAAARALFSGDDRVRVLTADWTALREFGPFDLLFCDGGGKREDPDGVVGMLTPGGILVLDDFAPATTWPQRYGDGVDDLRMRYLTHLLLVATEVRVTDTMAVVVGVYSAA
ncbi:MAG: class I SAM-dependent methyltransferase [Umezawaea sp.]